MNIIFPFPSISQRTFSPRIRLPESSISDIGSSAVSLIYLSSGRAPFSGSKPFYAAETITSSEKLTSIPETAARSASFL